MFSGGKSLLVVWNHTTISKHAAETPIKVKSGSKQKGSAVSMYGEKRTILVWASKYDPRRANEHKCPTLVTLFLQLHLNGFMSQGLQVQCAHSAIWWKD